MLLWSNVDQADVQAHYTHGGRWCELLKDVCLDSGTIIIYDEKVFPHRVRVEGQSEGLRASSMLLCRHEAGQQLKACL